MPRATKKRALARLHGKLRVRAVSALVAAECVVPRPIVVRASNRKNRVTIIIAPVADDSGAGVKPGRWLSTAETLIVERVRESKRAEPRGRITQAMIAARAGLPFDQGAKALIRNLVDREILTHDDAAGYGLAPGV